MDTNSLQKELLELRAVSYKGKKEEKRIERIRTICKQLTDYWREKQERTPYKWQGGQYGKQHQFYH